MALVKDHKELIISHNKDHIHSALTELKINKTLIILEITAYDDALITKALSMNCTLRVLRLNGWDNFNCLIQGLKKNSTLKELSLIRCSFNNNFFMESLRCLKIEKLKFQECHSFSIEGTYESMSKSLENNLRIKELILECSRYSEEFSLKIGSILGAFLIQNQKLKIFSLPNNELVNLGILRSKYLNQSKLHLFDFSRIKLIQDDVENLACAVKTAQYLKKLNLSHSKINAKQSSLLWRSLSYCSSLKSVNLEGIKLGDKGLAAIMKSQQLKPTITSLNISKNLIRLEGLKLLGICMKNLVLENLDLSSNPIGDRCVILFSLYLVNVTHLISLDLSNCFYKSGGTRALLEAAKLGNCIRTLVIGKSEKYQSSQVLSSISKYLAHKSSIHRLELKWNVNQNPNFSMIPQSCKKSQTIFFLSCSKDFTDCKSQNYFELANAINILP